MKNASILKILDALQKAIQQEDIKILRVDAEQDVREVACSPTEYKKFEPAPEKRITFTFVHLPKKDQNEANTL